MLRKIGIDGKSCAVPRPREGRFAIVTKRWARDAMDACCVRRFGAGRNGSLARFLLTIWLFGLYFGVTETFLLDRQNPTWFMFVLAVGGLHFLARFAVRR